MKNIINKTNAIILTVLICMSCSDSWLNPDALSFYAPENTFVDKAGFDGLLLSARKQLRHEFYNDNSPICSEYYFSDIAVHGEPSATSPHNMNIQITPTGDANAKIIDFGTAGYWGLCWGGIKYGNICITRIDDIKWDNQNDRNEILAEGYFHRAYWYYRLINQFGDVPWLSEEITSPRLDFVSSSRETILNNIYTDMAFAVQWLPTSVQPGQVNRAAGQHLFAKICLELRKFDEAIAATNWVINNSGHTLMKTRFGEYANDPKYDVMWDLHQKENKSIGTNKEGILIVQDKFGMEGNTTLSPPTASTGGTFTMRNCTPYWVSPLMRDPDGVQGCKDTRDNYLVKLGRGVGFVRTTNWFNYEIWTDATDLRHSGENWFGKEEYIYNNPASKYYGKPFVESAIIASAKIDTIRNWYPFPYNKIYVADEERTTTNRVDGGHSDWYVFRLAETYLLRAEAYWWKGDNTNAAKDINEVRTRAKATPVQSSQVDIEYIFAERARELYMEEPRKTELTRVAYIMAKLNRNGYTIENMSTGKNWYYDIVKKNNNFFKNETTYGPNAYKMSPYHVYWPIPQSEILANQQGHMNQTPGYPGSETNIQPL